MNLNTKYDIDSSEKPVIFTLESGYGQLTHTRLVLSGNEILSTAGNISNFNLGTNKSLNGKELSIWTTVKDVQVGTNRTGVRFGLKGGVKDVYWPPVVQDVANGGIAYYHIVIYFY